MNKLIHAISFAAALGMTGSAMAQSYPSRPITLVAPIAAGGAVDSVARILAEKLQERLRQSVVVENRPGAGAMIAIDSVAKAAPDGHTLLLMEPASVPVKWLHKTVPFDVITDIAPIAMIATMPPVLFAHSAVAANDVKALIAYSKVNPGKLSVGNGRRRHTASSRGGHAKFSRRDRYQADVATRRIVSQVDEVGRVTCIAVYRCGLDRRGKTSPTACWPP
jgi:tripartite-type tricarboxylate transporter receptor subunit TctC